MKNNSKKTWYVRYEDTKKNETEVDGPYRNYLEAEGRAIDLKTWGFSPEIKEGW